MNLDRFGFKAKSRQKGRYWLYASLDFYDGTGSYGVRYHLEPGGEASFNPAGIDLETICQCTGLKDSDEKLIYENDYLKITGKEGNIEKALVQYDENILEYLLIVNKSELPIRFMLLWLEEDKKCYVIGNKFDKEERVKE